MKATGHCQAVVVVLGWLLGICLLMPVAMAAEGSTGSEPPLEGASPRRYEATLPVPVGAETEPDANWGESIIWGETEMTVGRALALGASGLAGRDTSEVVAVKYPRVVMIRDSTRTTVDDSGGLRLCVKAIRFLGPSGELRKEVRLSEAAPVEFDYPGKDTLAARGLYRRGLAVSKGGRYICITQYIPRFPVADKESPLLLSTIMDTEGNALWNVTHRISVAGLSPNGTYFVGENSECGGQCPVAVYGPHGRIADIRRGIGDRRAESGTLGLRVDFSHDGSYFALITETVDLKMQTDSYTDRYRGHLVLVDKNGKELWRRENIAKAWPAGGRPVVAVLDDGTIQVATREPEEHVYYFDRYGHSVGAR
jgi:hypothetical protein